MNEVKDYTIVEKYQQRKNQTVAIRPYFNPNKENMGLEKYGLAMHDGVYHEESLACLEINGVKRYVTGLNEFAPEVKALPPKERKIKVKEIRKVVAELEASLGANVVDPEDIIQQFGADTARWFMMSDSPPERDVEWTNAGVEAAWRHLQKVWRIASKIYYEGKEIRDKKESITFP